MNYYNFILAFFSVYLAKVLAFSATYQDSIILLGLFSLVGYMSLLKSREPKEVNAQLKKDIADLKQAISVLNLDKTVGNQKKPFKF
jgi:hypothetical protein